MFICARDGFSLDIFLFITKIVRERNGGPCFLKAGVDRKWSFNLYLFFLIGIDVMEEKLGDQIFI